MTNTLLLSALLLFIPKVRNKVDQYILEVAQKLKTLRNQQETEEEANVRWVNFLISRIRSGYAAQDALLQSIESIKLTTRQTATIKAIIDKQSTECAIGIILRNGIVSGGKCLNPLRRTKKNIQQRIHAERKAKAASLQCRAQAVTMCLLPWALLIAQSLASPVLFAKSIESPIMLASIALALTLTILGFSWMQKIIKSVIHGRPKGTQTFEKKLHYTLFRIQSELSAGEVPNSSSNEPSYKELMQSRRLTKKLPNQLVSIFDELQQAINSSQQLGAPIGEHIDELILEFNEYLENKLLERVQLLPLKLLLPISTTILPAAILTIIAPIIPLALKAMDF